MNISPLALIFLFISPFIFMRIVCVFLPKRVNDLTYVTGYKYLDSLRGLAACTVMLHHTWFSFNYFNDGKWNLESKFTVDTPAYLMNVVNHFGGAGVMIFFMITGFLFFDKIIKSEGKINLTSFYIRRFFRIVPAYLFTVALVILLSLITGFVEYDSARQYISVILSWLSFGFIEQKDISIIMPGGLIVAGVFWTLVIEWKYYLLIPAISSLCERKRAIIAVLVIFALVFLFSRTGTIRERDGVVFISFLAGIFSSMVTNSWVRIPARWLESKLIAAMFLALFVYILLTKNQAYSITGCLSIAAIFIIVSNGNSLIGILKFKGFKSAGVISYSVYLLHGLSLFLINGVLLSGGSYFYNSLIAVILTLLLSLFSYFYIEKKGVELGRFIEKKKK